MTGAIILTHGDVDGMTCAAQLIRRERSDWEIVFSNARWVAGRLFGLLRREGLPARVYVTDIPAEDQAAAAVERLAEAGVAVYWIDHHPWPEGVFEQIQRFCAAVVYHEALSTPAGVLLGEWLKAEDPYCAQVGRICYASEKGTPWERDWFRLLSSYIGNCEPPVLERLAFDQGFTEDDRQRIEERVRQEILSEELLAQEPQVVETASGKRMAVYDICRAPGIYLGQKVFRHHPVDLCLMRIAPHKWQVSTNPRLPLSLGLLLGDHMLDGLRITVAGRPDRLLSMQAVADTDAPEVHARITTWVAGRL